MPEGFFFSTCWVSSSWTKYPRQCTSLNLDAPLTEGEDESPYPQGSKLTSWEPGALTRVDGIPPDQMSLQPVPMTGPLHLHPPAGRGSQTSTLSDAPTVPYTGAGSQQSTLSNNSTGSLVESLSEGGKSTNDTEA